MQGASRVERGERSRADAGAALLKGGSERQKRPRERPSAPRRYGFGRAGARCGDQAA